MSNLRFAPLIETILKKRHFAVVGASNNPEKYGHKVYKSLKKAGYSVYPVHPHEDYVDGDPAYPRLDNVPVKLDCVVTIVPPEVTFEIVRQAGALRIPYLWMQPGSESQAAVIEAHSYGIQAVYGGPCIMVAVATHKVAG
jgi:predicted CoA-binding protein